MRSALAFLTPFGGSRTPTTATFTWFPVVGALIGLAVGGVWWGASEVWSPAVAAALAVAADLALTGMLHVDGLADTADGVLPPLPRERRLEVMATPDVGAFGVAVVVVVLLLRFAALASVEPEPLVVAGLWCWSRTLMASAALRLPYARDEGLATAFLGGSSLGVTAIGLVVSFGLVSAIGDVAGKVTLLVAALAGLVVVGLAVRRLGGFTGDVLGAAGVVGETAGLLALAARW